MATLLLQSAGAAIGGLFGPLGAVIGRAAGAIAGRAIDQRLFSRDRVIKGPRLEEAQIMSSADGAPMPRVYGRVRIGGQIVWATRFEEKVSRSQQGGGKGGGGVTTVKEYSYFANFCVALCEGPVAMLGRVWADGVEIDRTRHEIRFYPGSEEQEPDPLIVAKQGEAPAFRGTAHVVFEGFALEDYGNRIPQLTFEIVRPVARLDGQIRAMTVIPGSTEFGYAPEPVKSIAGQGKSRKVNRNNLTHATDWQASLDELQALCPAIESVALVVAWFGNDLRAGHCEIRPRVEHNDSGGKGWRVAGLSRDEAVEVSRVDGAPAYGGTPDDDSVVAAIADLKSRGLKVVLYPFVMMDIPAGNGLPDPWGGSEQAAYLWRGLITCDPAPGEPGTADGSATAASQLADFSGSAGPGDFDIDDGEVEFSGGDDWGYRRFVLHYAHLAVAAGGVDGFLVGSELRGLTTLRDGAGAFPFVETLRQLAGEVRDLLGPEPSISYGADWSEYFGHHPQDGSGDVYFHLDPLWADPAVDCIGIDSYMPLSDWRLGGDGHAPHIRSPFDPDYLIANVAGGEGHDWYYASAEDRAAAIRTPITDGFGEPWVWRFKDIRSWWGNAHHERIGGVRSPTPTAWVPESKPIRLTELGCAAIAMGANQPNVFLDAKSAQSALPYFSTGARADLMQNRFLAAHYDFWNPGTEGLDADRNPVSAVYGGRMISAADIFPWAWDARPFPRFPADVALWSDGPNWHTGHWLNGRLGGCPAGELCAAIAADFGIELDDIRADGFLDGYVVPGPMPARAALEPLLTLFGIAYAEEGGERRLHGKAYGALATLAPNDLVEAAGEPVLTRRRDHESELPRQAEINHASVAGDFEPVTSHSRRIETESRRIVSFDLPAVIPASTATGAMEARLRDAWIGREKLRVGVSNRHLALSAGDQIAFAGGAIAGQWRIESIGDGAARLLDLRAVADFDETAAPLAAPDMAIPGAASFGAPDLRVMNLPVAPGVAAPHVHVALAAEPFARRYAVFASPDASGFTLRGVVTKPAVIAALAAPLAAGPEGRWDLANFIELDAGPTELSGLPDLHVLNGANAAAVLSLSGEWEVLQFAGADLQPGGGWLLSRLLRGQLGTENAMLTGAEAGAPFVLLDDAVTRIDLPSVEAGLPLNWRAGPAADPASAETYAEASHLHAALGARPLSPVHLAARRLAGGDIRISWVRRSRIDADGWEAPDVALGEASERYRVDILDPDDLVVRSLDTATPQATYEAVDETADFGGPLATLRFAVAQIAGNGAAGQSRAAAITL